MQVTYLGDMFFGTDFIYALAALTIMIWLLMKSLFNYDNMGHAAMFAVLALILLPYIFAATAFLPAFVIILLLGGIAVSQTLRWPMTTSIMVVFLALLAGAILLPAL